MAVLDADKEGFLRSETALVQVSGRAARNVDGRVIFYADERTDSMDRALVEMERRRVKQHAYNVAHDITPTSTKRGVRDTVAESYAERDYVELASAQDDTTDEPLHLMRARLEREMLAAAKELRFEDAAKLRDMLRRTEKKVLLAGEGKEATAADGDGTSA